MDLVLSRNAITAQKHLSREDMSLVLYSIKTDATTSFTAAKSRLYKSIKKLVQSPNFVLKVISDFRIMYVGFLNLFLVPYFCHYEEEHDEGGGHCSELWVQSCA